MPHFSHQLLLHGLCACVYVLCLFLCVLSYPSDFVSLGVTDDDFNQTLSSSEMRALFLRTGTTLSDSEFQEVWAAAAKHAGGESQVIIALLRKFVNMFMDARSRGAVAEVRQRAKVAPVWMLLTWHC